MFARLPDPSRRTKKDLFHPTHFYLLPYLFILPPLVVSQMNIEELNTTPFHNPKPKTYLTLVVLVFQVLSTAFEVNLQSKMIGTTVDLNKILK